MNNRKPLGRVLCKGSGLKVFCEIKLSRQLPDKEKETKVFRYNLGSLQKISAECNRQTAFNYVAGRANAAGVLKGIRNSYGEIVFEQMDANIIHRMFKDVKKFNKETERLTETTLDSFSFDDYTLLETDAPLIGSAEENPRVKLYENEVVMLDDLPPIDIIVIGYADQIDSVNNEVYEVGNTYEFRLNKVTFMSETFGISPGSPLHNVATKVLILGGLKPWHKIAGQKIAGGDK